MSSANCCSRCGKPVYFAERKTSLGKNWHPNCLRCQECGKVLTPGQHAERKGVPYCHKPCYSALFGPQILGYGSNVSSPANFRKSSDLEMNNKPEKSEDSEETTFFFTGANLSPLQSRDQKKEPDKGMHLLKTSSSSSVNTQSGNSESSGYQSHSGNSSLSGSLTALDTTSDSGNDAGLKLIYESSPNSRKSGSLESQQQKKSTNVMRSNSDVGKFMPMPDRNARKLRGPELFKKVQSYNEYHKGKRGQTLSYIEEDGNVRVRGPLRIYWGLKKPIMLKQYDEVPSRDIPKKRYSVITDTRELKSLPELQNESESSSPIRKTFTDDSVLSSPVTEVVMRRTNIKKSNTVAYRGDKPNKWKRASINGHIYNYDTGESMSETSVFTPVLGSCTSVTVDNKMTVQEVIRALLEKFKVENQPEEYNLCIVSEHEDERVLKDSDIPLLERLVSDPTDTVKLFIRDQPEKVPVVIATNIPEDASPTTEVPVGETPLPEEVEQLISIPEPVLRGLLAKFKADEEREIKGLRAKYDRIRRRVEQIIKDKKENTSRC